MITEEIFSELINRPESTVLDFKREQYKFCKDSTDKTHAFIKDIISFCNTVREETAYIIIGISKEDNKTELIGIDKNIDDAIFQEKIKDKVYPKPKFLYYPFTYQGKTFGIIEIPVTKYQEPITPVTNFKGLDVGKVYYRRGSSNSEALAREIILINDWLKEMPKRNNSYSLLDKVGHLLSLATSGKMPLSHVITQTLKIAKENNLEQLLQFCNGELLGWSNIYEDSMYDYLKYRFMNFIASPQSLSITFSPYTPHDSRQMYKALLELDGFYEQKLLFSESILDIESNLQKLTENKGNIMYVKEFTLNVINRDNKSKSDQKKIKIYAIKDNFDALYISIKQKFIEELLAI